MSYPVFVRVLGLRYLRLRSGLVFGVRLLVGLRSGLETLGIRNACVRTKSLEVNQVTGMGSSFDYTNSEIKIPDNFADKAYMNSCLEKIADGILQTTEP